MFAVASRRFVYRRDNIYALQVPNIPIISSGRHVATERRPFASQPRCHVSFAGPDDVGGPQLSGGVALAAR